MEATKSTDNIIILWLLAAATIILFLVSMPIHKVAAPTMQWQADSSWVKSW